MWKTVNWKVTYSSVVSKGIIQGTLFDSPSFPVQSTLYMDAPGGPEDEHVHLLGQSPARPHGKALKMKTTIHVDAILSASYANEQSRKQQPATPQRPWFAENSRTTGQLLSGRKRNCSLQVIEGVRIGESLARRSSWNPSCASVNTPIGVFCWQDLLNCHWLQRKSEMPGMPSRCKQK